MNGNKDIDTTEEVARNRLNEKLNHIGVLFDLFPDDGKLFNLLETNFANIPFGTHIAVPFFKFNQVAWHHGIYVSEGKVIDMMEEQPNIQSRSLNDFFKINNVSPLDFVIVNYSHDSPEMLALTCLRALFLEQNPPTITYHAVYFNCESFATFCRSGYFRSVSFPSITFLDFKRKTIKSK